MNKKVFIWFMTLSLIFTLVPSLALASGTDSDIRYGYYINGQWQESDIQNSNFDIEGLQSISKTAVPVVGKDNTYNITLNVVMSQTTTTAPGAAATVLVVDTSGSTDWCSECGFEPDFNLIPFGTQYHKKTCSRYNNSSFETRLDAEKTAALEFVDTFSGCVTDGVFTENADLSRYVAIVSFDTRATVNLTWVNISSKAGYDQAKAAINKLKAGGGTNLDDGLIKANTLFGEDTVKNITAKNAIALTDGTPTYAMKNDKLIGDGGEGSSEVNSQTQATATILKSKAKLYTVCFGAAGEVTYPGGPTVGKFLEESIATPASADGKTKYAFNAANADELYNAFAAITDTIVNGINAGIVNDSIPAGVEQTSGTISPDETTGSFVWELHPETAAVETSGNTTTYTYTYTYTVKIDPTTDNAKAGNWIPTNGRTTLTVGDQTVDFGIPAVKAKYYEIHYYVYDNETEGYVENTDLTKTLLSSGDDISSYNVPLTKTGHTFSGWFTAEDRNEVSAWTPDKMPAENINVYGAFMVNDYKVNYIVNNDSSFNKEITLKYGEAIPGYAPEKAGHTFSGWFEEEALTNAWTKPKAMPDNDITVYGIFTANDYTVTYYLKNSDGDFDKDNTVTLAYGTALQDYTPEAVKGYDFHGWYTEEALTNLWANPGTMPAYNIDLYGEQVCVLNFDDHFAYIIGYKDGTVKPQAKITRAEVATIFFRLLTEESRELNKATENPFSDVQAGDWYNNAISTLANMKILRGYEDGTFQPNKAITRAEMATIISAFANLTENTKTFTDIEGHWAQKYIELAGGNGWVTGYEDGTFKPNNEITRAETMTMINRVMKRVPKDETCLLDGMTTYPDCVSGQWYYIAVQEATNSHYFQREVGATDGSEKWLELRENFDWSQLEK